MSDQFQRNTPLNERRVCLQYIAIIFSILVAFLGYLKNKDIYNPLTILFSIFGLILFFASLHLYGLYRASQYTYTIIFVGLISFFIGYCFIELIKTKKPYSGTKYFDFFKYTIRYKLLYYICFIIIIFLSYRTMQVIEALSQGHSMSVIRSDAYSIINVSDWYSIISQYVVKPIVFALIPLTVIDFFIGKKKLVVITLIIIVLTALGDGGRFIFLYILAQVLITAIIFKDRIGFSNKIVFNRKMKLSVISLFIVISIAIFNITELRGVSSSFFRHIYFYTAGCIPHLDYRLNLLESYTYGITFFRGYITTLLVFLNGTGILNYPNFFTEAVQLAHVEDRVLIASDSYYNAFVTPFFYFYLDGGLIGVIISSFVYGIIFALSYYFVKNKRNILNVAIFLLLMQGAFTSMVRWQFIIPAYALSFVFVIFLVKIRNRQGVF